MYSVDQGVEPSGCLSCELHVPVVHSFKLLHKDSCSIFNVVTVYAADEFLQTFMSTLLIAVSRHPGKEFRYDPFLTSFVGLDQNVGKERDGDQQR